MRYRLLAASLLWIAAGRGISAEPLGISYVRQVQPILERRCVVSHACYDAPCQLKLRSP